MGLRRSTIELKVIAEGIASFSTSLAEKIYYRIESEDDDEEVFDITGRSTIELKVSTSLRIATGAGHEDLL